MMKGDQRGAAGGKGIREEQQEERGSVRSRRSMRMNEEQR